MPVGARHRGGGTQGLPGKPGEKGHEVTMERPAHLAEGLTA